MSFLQPLALFGLAAVAVPPLLHLLARQVPPLVIFPSLRYLTETERRQSRKLKLRHLLLMILRMFIIACIVLAASRPIARAPFGGDHEPSSVAIIVDNSLSSGAIVGGRRVLDVLIDHARDVLGRTDPDDRLWLMLADGIPRRVAAPDAEAVLDTITPQSVHLDLVRAVAIAGRVLEPTAAGPGEVVVISDLQASALAGEAASEARVLVWRAPGSPRENRGLDSAWVEPPVWSPEGQVIGAIGGSGETPSTVQLRIGGTLASRGFGSAGDMVALDGAPAPGWHIGTLELDPDELRADDEWRLAIRVAPPAQVSTGPGIGPFVEQAMNVLELAGRIAEGADVLIADRPGSGTSIVFPPEDPALVGSVNRDLERRGVRWRFGDEVVGEWPLDPPWGRHAGDAVFRRRLLIGDGAVIAEVGGAPWLVRDGNVILVASRFHPRWTNLPVSAGFVPVVDLLLNRVAAHPVSVTRAAPGDPAVLPMEAAAVLDGRGSEIPLGEGAIVAPLDPGVYFLRGQAGDTIGALEVNHDARESRLTTGTDDEVRRALGPDASVLDQGGIDRELFQGARRADLTGPFLFLAIVLATVELILATVGGGRAAED